MGGVTTVEGGLVVLPGGAVRADLVLRDGRVAALAADAGEHAASAEERIDATGLVVLPGGIDAHTHFEEPDPIPLEGFETGGRAAAAGGITTVVEMPQARPTTFSRALLDEKIALVRRHAIVDMALWGGVTMQHGQTADDLRAMAAGGAAAFKSFMASSSPFFPAVTSAHLLEAMTVIAELGLPYGLHAEDDDLMKAGIERLRAAGRKDSLAHAESRPPLVETVAVALALTLAEATGCHVHVCHVASAGALALIKTAKGRGVPVTCETCPQYLVLDTGCLERRAGFARCAPALRDPAEVAAIWPYLLDGTIDLIGSDHCAFTPESKEAGSADIFEAPLGLAGVQTMLPLLWGAAVVERGMAPERFADLLSRNPARIFGLDRRKGVLAPGHDADLVLLDPAARWTVRVEDILHRQPWTPYEGMTVTGRVKRTLRRGETIYDDARDGAARSPARPGSGRYLPRGAA